MNTTTEAFIFGFVKQCHALNIDVETTVALLEAVQTKELYANESFQKGFLEKSAARPPKGLLAGVSKFIGSFAKPFIEYGDRGLDAAGRGISAAGKATWKGVKKLRPMVSTPSRAINTAGALATIPAGYAYHRMRQKAELGESLGGAPIEGEDSSEGGYGGGGGRSSYGTGSPFDYVARSYNAQSGADMTNNSRGGGKSYNGSSALDSARNSHQNLLDSKANLQEDMRTASPVNKAQMFLDSKNLDKQIAESTKNQIQLNKQVAHADEVRKFKANDALTHINNQIPKFQKQLDRNLDLANGGGNFVTRWWNGGEQGAIDKARAAGGVLEQLERRKNLANDASNATSNADYP